ncbi:MAG: hypothetical protein LBM25_04620 [Bacteroidales bacterium]|jgi:hypothetical protein|nr:hypothetical protein [Bacteroidales bacterium]
MTKNSSKKFIKLLCGLFILSLATNVNAQKEQTNFKMHNFGIGIGASTFPIIQNYSAPNGSTEGKYDLTNAFVWNISLKYDLKLNKIFSLSFEPTYINQLLSFKDVVSGTPYVSYSEIPFSTSEMTIPVLANFRIGLHDNIKLLTSLGVGAKYYFEKSKKIIDGDGSAGTFNGNKYYSVYANTELNKKNSFSYEFLLRAGLEIEAKHNYQILLTYRFSPDKNYYFSENGYPALFTNNFRVTMLELGFNIFL